MNKKQKEKTHEQTGIKNPIINISPQGFELQKSFKDKTYCWYKKIITNQGK